MTTKSIINNYDAVKEKRFQDRLFKHRDVVELLAKLPSTFITSELGKSVNGKSINVVRIGKGKTKVMLWSQMHGDEATGTMVLFDLFNFLQRDNELSKLLTANCKLFFIPMVNPDGAEAFTRRNAQQIDINRDFLQALSPEAKILKEAQNQIKPDFGFNLHDQTTLWSVTGNNLPATLSFLAPAFDQELHINQTRENAMLVIADIFTELNSLLPNQIGLFDDEFEPRAFGDNFQRAGMSTILFEAGGFSADFEKQEIRKYYFASILSGLVSIANKSYEHQKLENYSAIPKNNKQIFHYLLHDVMVNGNKTSVGINYEEYPNPDGKCIIKTYSIQDIGDLSLCNGYQIIDAKNLKLDGTLEFNNLANFKLYDKSGIVLNFENGELR